MHYFILIYFDNKPLHLSIRLAAHHQEDQLCVNSNWYKYQRWTVHFVKSLQLLTNKFTYITFT